MGYQDDKAHMHARDLKRWQHRFVSWSRQAEKQIIQQLVPVSSTKTIYNIMQITSMDCAIQCNGVLSLRNHDSEQ